MGDALDKIVALSGTVRVEGYQRTSSTGKTVHVGAYTRSPGDMKTPEITAELNSLRGKVGPQSENRAVALRSELRKRASEPSAIGKKANALADKIGRGFKAVDDAIDRHDDRQVAKAHAKGKKSYFEKLREAGSVPGMLTIDTKTDEWLAKRKAKKHTEALKKRTDSSNYKFKH